MPPSDRHATDLPDTGSDRAAYALLAAEYDRADHRTTRVLEALSARGFARGASGVLRARSIGSVLEVGAGTGALTDALLRAWPPARVLATDASAEMLDMLVSKLDPADAQRVTVAVLDVRSSSSSSSLCSDAPDLIAAGLADPFLDVATLATLRAACDDGTRLFVSVPSRAWARRERLGRLAVPIGTTRFRTRDGSVVFAPSSTYDEGDLRSLLADAGFSAEIVATERSGALWSQPEVCWAIAAPAPIGDATNGRGHHLSTILSGG